MLWWQYRVGQLYTISKHSHQESEKGEGVEVVKNEPHEDPVHGPGQFTEKRVHLSRSAAPPGGQGLPAPSGSAVLGGWAGRGWLHPPPHKVLRRSSSALQGGCTQGASSS